MSNLAAKLTGKTLAGRYRIEHAIGSGGMGTVFRAVDVRLGRRVAVKVFDLKGAAGAPEDPAALDRLRRRFRREVETAARLTGHPNVVALYDSEVDAALQVEFCVMELLEGEGLDAFLRRGLLPLATALDLLRQAAAGIAAGHRQKLVHRDVKPSNLFVTDAGDGVPRVRVLDFGIVKLLEDADAHGELTLEGGQPGTRAWASPEQLRGERELTPASDVFGLGLVGFRLLTGTDAFTEQDRARMEIGGEVPVPSLRARRPDVPEEVERVVRRALAPAPADRWPDAAELAKALAAVEAELGAADLVLLPPPGGGTADDGDDRTVAWSAPAGELTELFPGDTDPHSSAADLKTAGVADDVVDGEMEDRRRESSDVEPPSIHPRWRRLAPAALLVLAFSGGVAVAATNGGVRNLLRSFSPPAMPTAADARAENQAGLQAFRSGSYDRALEHFTRALQTDPGHPEYRNNAGYALFRLGRAHEAVRVLENVVAAHPERQVAYSNLADAYVAAGDTAAAISTLERLLAMDPPRTRRRNAELLLAKLRAAQPPLAEPELVDSFPIPDVVPGYPELVPPAEPPTVLPDDPDDDHLAEVEEAKRAAAERKRAREEPPAAPPARRRTEPRQDGLRDTLYIGRRRP